MFGRDLTEQVRADDRGTGRTVPIIVEKCLEAVEALGKFLRPRFCFEGIVPDPTLSCRS